MSSSAPPEARFSKLALAMAADADANAAIPTKLTLFVDCSRSTRDIFPASKTSGKGSFSKFLELKKY
jgi:hypothetical protein